MRHSFQVDLRGVVDLLSAHLYSSPDVYVRELVQNAVDALAARGPEADDRPVVIECHERPGGPPLLSVEDEGVGLTVPEVHELLATIGSSSKRDGLLGPDVDYLGRFGIGLLSCFLVSDDIRVVSRSVRGGPGVSWRGHSDGTYELRELADGEGRATPGTTVWVTARPGLEDRLHAATVRQLVRRYAGLLARPILLRTSAGEERLAGRPLPWAGQDTERLLAWGEAELGERFLDAVPLGLPAAGLTGVAFVLSTSPSPSSRQRHRVHLKRMLLSDAVDGLLPDWAFFVRVVVDTSALQPLASREGLYEDATLAAVREGLGTALRSWLAGLADRDPQRLQRLVRVHALALKALAVHDDELLRLFAPWLPVDTSLGRMTLTEVMARGPVRYAGTAEDFSQMAQVATAESICLVNAGYTYDEELLLRLPDVLPGVDVERVDPEDLAAVLRPVIAADQAGAAALVARCRTVLAPFSCDVEVREFSPASLPSLYTAGDGARFARELDETRQVADSFWGPMLGRIAAAQPVSREATLVLNWRHPVVRRLAGQVGGDALRTAVEVLYLQALLLGRHPLRGRETTLLSGALGRLIEGSLHGA
ncbi:HSP90 family protein [Blastococcus tunisiensis]|uniref:Molecular chaperone HtpG n=1 Tax=Blastococcus tunisiensis TaxID=1798228 RepID=A0A1I2KIX4_9ACTN|nr:HSP90 family protein [Blastococcus sp. DSM 46838]SFF66945.1 molecular chaperone HtpG [Blastococcus sp. DSM 46838]